MQFFYHKDSGAESIIIDSKEAHYLFRVRRFKQGEILLTSNLSDMQLYSYKHEKKNTFKLIGLHSEVVQPKANTNIILAIIDMKDIYGILPILNALNVDSIQFFYADFSQKNRKIDMKRAQNILQHSCMQCGRMKPLKIAIHNNLESVCKSFPNAIAIDFADSNLETWLAQNIENQDSVFLKYTQRPFENLTQQERRYFAKSGIIIGCEGGFSRNERMFLYATKSVYSLQIPFILTAHNTSVYIASICV